jgi:rRNA small subunit aminocarboxypropyltransferase
MTPDILILRDPRESAKKCSLTPLRGRDGVQFVNHKGGLVVETAGRFLLHHEGEELSPADADFGILLVDSSWRRLPTLLRSLDGDPPRRRLPALKTAYPRKSSVFEDPDAGLASIEALFAATCLLGRPQPELLSDYRWREAFLDLNRRLLGLESGASE